MNRTVTWLTRVSIVTLALLAQGPSFARAQAMPAANSPATSPAAAVIRIKAGLDKPVTDKAGQVWEADAGFVGGDTIERATAPITGTDSPQLFRSEHYDMTAFSRAVPNGKYTVKLYFAETYEDVTAAGQRIFTVDIEGQTLKDFDPFKEAGGANKAVIKSFDVEVKGGKLDIAFTAKEQAPQINAIEIIPRS